MKKRKMPPRGRYTESGNIIKLERTVLDNGIRILTEKVPAVESIALGIMVNSGSRNEPAEFPGIAHFMEHASFKRTKKMTSRQIANKFESVGAYSNAYTTKEYTFLYVRALAGNLQKALNILLEITFNPVFLKREIDKERQIILEEIKSYDDDPEELIFDYGDELLFEGSSLAHPILGTEKSIERIGIKELEQFHRKNYTPSNIIISATGNLNHEKIVKKVDRFLSSNYIANYEQEVISPREIKKREKVYKKSISQAHLLLGRRIGGINSDDRFGLAVLNVLYGDGMSSRLYQRLRERNGLAYSVYSTLQLYKDAGAFYTYAATDKDQIARAKRLIINEMDKLILKPPAKSELKRAKEQLKSGIIMELESLSARMQNLAKNELFFGKVPGLLETMENIEEVDLEKIKYLTEKYLNSNDWSVLELLPEE